MPKKLILAILVAMSGGVPVLADTATPLIDADGDTYTALICGLPELPCTMAQLDAGIGTDVMTADIDDTDPEVGDFCSANADATFCSE